MSAAGRTGDRIHRRLIDVEYEIQVVERCPKSGPHVSFPTEPFRHPFENVVRRCATDATMSAIAAAAWALRAAKWSRSVSTFAICFNTLARFSKFLDALESIATRHWETLNV